MKNIKIISLLSIGSVACSLFPYAEFELLADAKSIHRQLRALVSRCEKIELKEGKRQFDEIRSFYNEVRNRAHEGCAGFSDKEKSDILLNIFKETDNNYQTLYSMAVIADQKCAFCQYAKQELKKMEAAELEKNKNSK